MTDAAAVVAAVCDRVTPDGAERRRLASAVEALTERTEAAVADLPVTAEVLQVGSTARGTWLAGDRDIDLFVRFPTSLDRERLETYGLAVGHAVLPDGHEEFAEHPYVKGEFDGFDVDLVPCYDVDDAASTRSSVDRTPFHTSYLLDRLDDDLAGEARAFKAFLKGVGAYGSDLRTRGFSGYLSELLVLEHGGVVSLLRAAADWQPPVRYDPESHGTTAFDDPLVVVDPTDPERNVAAVCSAENVARLQHHARDFLADPREALFVADEPAPLSPADVRAHLDRRRTTPVAVAFDPPDVVDDQLYPQLRRSLSGVSGELGRRGFRPLRSATMATDGRAALLVELAVAELPAVERHEGPPVAARDHAEPFYEAYADDPDAYGPFVDGERYVVEREREFGSAAAFLRSDALFDVALGANVADALAADYEVLVGSEVAALADSADLGRELARYFEPSP
jgi:tRNA nucleotidyltransferase (CCA-adding enzyme)